MDLASYLFVPGNRPERFSKAAACGADVVILDLEDAVCRHDKDAARLAVIEWCDRAHVGCALALRVNDATTEWFDQDVAAAARLPLHAVLLPKAEDASQIARLRSRLPDRVAIIPIVESARGVERVEAIARGGVQRIAFGTIDYALDLKLPQDDERALIHPASCIAIASRCAGIRQPIAGVTTALGSRDRLLADLAFAKAMGFGAKLCIHPNQVAAVNAAFVPTAQEIAWAKRVAAAVASAKGAAQVDGAMVDRPSAERAREILLAAGIAALPDAEETQAPGSPDRAAGAESGK